MIKEIIDYLPDYINISRYISEIKFLIICGDIGTGKSFFVDRYIKKSGFDFRYFDAESEIKDIVNYGRISPFIESRKVIVYDDIKIKESILKSLYEELNKFDYIQVIITVNKLSEKEYGEYMVFNVRYPMIHELKLYFNQIDDNGNKLCNNDLVKDILNLKEYNLFKIRNYIGVGFIDDSYNKDDSNKFNFKDSSFIMSLTITENIYRLDKFKDNIDEIDELRSINEDIYYDCLKLFYPNIMNMKLRYPKELLQLSNKSKVKTE